MAKLPAPSVVAEATAGAAGAGLGGDPVGSTPLVQAPVEYRLTVAPATGCPFAFTTTSLYTPNA